MVGDMIASTLHWAAAKLGREAALDAVRLGIAQFACEQSGGERFGADAWVRIKVECGQRSLALADRPRQHGPEEQA